MIKCDSTDVYPSTTKDLSGNCCAWFRGCQGAWDIFTGCCVSIDL